MTEDRYEDEINLLDLFLVIAKRKRLVLYITFGAAILTAIISLIMTPIYKAETRILPPQSSGSGMAAQLISQMAGGLDLGSIAGKTPADLYVGMLKSRTITDKIIDRFDIMQEKEFKFRDDARNYVLNLVEAQTEKKSGFITIAVEDKDPKRAADMANAYVEELKNFTKGLAISEASQRRLFYEEQLKDTKEALMKAENDMKAFQEKTGALRIDEQAKAIISGIADLRAKIAAKEVELKVLRSFTTPQNPDYQKVEEELKGLKIELARLESNEKRGHDPIMPTGRIPGVGVDYFRKLRELKFNETLYELLLKQYELAKLDESKDAVLIQVVDRAVPPDKRFKPKRRMMVMVATATGFFLSIFICFIMEFIDKMNQDAESRQKLAHIKEMLKFKKG
ncbi:MAG: Wzz/FepE/Etk N-terminal domain-containing protein [bacterium]